MTIEHEYGPYKLVLDESDPDTPAMVYGPNGGSATYDCACAEGTLFTTRCDDEEIPGPVLTWLSSFEREVAETYDMARAGMKEYQ